MIFKKFGAGQFESNLRKQVSFWFIPDPISIYISLQIDCLIRKIAVYFLWLSLSGHNRVADEAFLAVTT